MNAIELVAWPWKLVMHYVNLKLERGNLLGPCLRSIAVRCLLLFSSISVLMPFHPILSAIYIGSFLSSRPKHMLREVMHDT
jgi:hypothetical protein